MKRLIILFMLISLTIGAFGICCYARDNAELLSPALMVIANNTEMIKSEKNGNKIVFSAEDFAAASGDNDFSLLKIESLPEPSSGALMLGGLEVFEGQTISRSSISSLTFLPRAGAMKTGFLFSIDGEEYAFNCSMYFLSEDNYAPTSAGVDESFYAIETYKNIAVQGKMRCDDPEGDAVIYEITKNPKKGLVTLKNRSTGEYVYTPTRNFAGKDSFSYVATDKYGNRSAEITVDVWVSISEEGIVFRDMIGDSAHYGAIMLHDEGIMKGSKDEYGDVFLPNMSVYYGDFLAMAVKAAGIKFEESLSDEIGDELKSVPTEYKKAVSVAFNSGMIGKEEVACFDCTRYVTKAEACVIINNLLDISPSKIQPVFSDIDKVPENALDAVCALIDAGLMITDNGEVSANESLTRADAAILLSELMKRI